jgi:hypothetical protein
VRGGERAVHVVDDPDLTRIRVDALEQRAIEGKSPVGPVLTA